METRKWLQSTLILSASVLLLLHKFTVHYARYEANLPQLEKRSRTKKTFLPSWKPFGFLKSLLLSIVLDIRKGTQLKLEAIGLEMPWPIGLQTSQWDHVSSQGFP